ncbi:CBS domain-containing protein [halophilic archaeon]|nr:CBS domain-containing protein [halophilic archaeon]
MPVGDLGPENVVTAEPDTQVSDIVDRLRSENVGAIVVVEDDEPVGIVTDRDVALAVNEGGDVGDKSVQSVMTEDPVTLHEDEEAIEISRTIGEHNVRRIPVVDDDDKLTGIVTLDDLYATIGEQLDNVADTVEVQSPKYSP